MNRLFFILPILIAFPVSCFAESNTDSEAIVKYVSFFLNILFLLAGILAFYFFNKKWKAAQFDRMQKEKLKFFSELSYEIRTPLTMIMTPLAKLIAKGDNPSLLPTYNIMFKHSNELLQLINQIKDLYYLECRKKHIYVEEMNLTRLVSKLKDSFDILAEERELDFRFQSTPETIIGYADSEILSKILFNLISSAISRTERGSVNIEMSCVDKSELKIKIKDTGTAISEYSQKLMYEKYFSVDKVNEDLTIKSTLLLHLTNKIVMLHHGKINTQTDEKEGNLFELTIPINKDSYTQEELTRNNEIDAEFSTAPVLNLSIKSFSKESKKRNRKDSKVKMLVVEDNPDIRLLLREEFSDDYNIIEAENGKDALYKTLEFNPDIIISDILMPEMDGKEFCKKIRNNESTQLIPIVLLTACSSMNQQVEGLQVGADAYVTKPFDLDYLRAVVNRLLQSKAQSRQQAITESDDKKEEDLDNEPSVMDKVILDNINKLIQEHIDDSEFSVETLCKEMSLSRTHLNRKVKELTGESPASYIKQVRLRKAAILLKKKTLSISEIAFMTGFSSPSYFSQAFREYYGMTPKEFVNHR